MNEFLTMGGYAFYVWTSYALALLVLAMNWWLPRSELRSRRRSLLRHACPETTVKNACVAQTSVEEVAA